MAQANQRHPLVVPRGLEGTEKLTFNIHAMNQIVPRGFTVHMPPEKDQVSYFMNNLSSHPQLTHPMQSIQPSQHMQQTLHTQGTPHLHNTQLLNEIPPQLQLTSESMDQVKKDMTLPVQHQGEQKINYQKGSREGGCTVYSAKRKCNPDTWKANVRKKLRNTGQCYHTKDGNVVPARSVGPVCKMSCPRRCHTKMSEKERCNIFSSYWRTGSYERQRDFIVSHVYSAPVQRRRVTGTSRRNTTNHFYLPHKGKKREVCRTFFLNTLGIGRSTVQWAMNKRDQGGLFVIPDKRGKHTVSKIPEIEKESIRLHIKSFSLEGSHHSQKSSKRRFLDPDLTFKRLYTSYKEKCLDEGRRPQKESLYRSILTEFNVGFHMPKKNTS